MRSIQRECCSRGLGADQWVDDDDSAVAFDEADVRKVQSAHLIDALDDLVQALLGHQLTLPPQTGMHGRRSVTVQECVDVVVPDHPAIGSFDHARLQRGDEAAVSCVEIGGVVERQRAQMLGVRRLDDGGRWLEVHAATICIRQEWRARSS